MGENLHTQSCNSVFNTTSGYPIERKVVNPCGRLGSLYDASTDNLVDQYAAPKICRKMLNERPVCRLFSGDQSRELVTYLRDLDFGDAIRQSICLEMVASSGVSRFIHYNQSIDQNTRFLYYSYKTKKEKLVVKARKGDRVVAMPVNPSGATHMITKIVWGFEILCIIQIPNNQSVNAIDQLLIRILTQLKNSQIPIQLDVNDQRLLSLLTNNTIYGSESCVNQPNITISSILARLQDFHRDDRFHQPLVYIMQPLRWLYNSPRFVEPCVLPDPNNSHIARVEIIVNRIKKQLKDVSKIIQSLPRNFHSSTLNSRLKDCQQHYRFLLDSQDNLHDRLRRALSDVRRQRVKLSVLDNIISDQRYECLQKVAMEKHQSDLTRLFNKSIFIEKLKSNGMEYINAHDIRPNQKMLSKVNEVDTLLRQSYTRNSFPVILWYSSDRLQRIEADKFQQIYQELALEKWKAAHRTNIVYIDFTYFEDRLEDFVIVRLSFGDTPTTQNNPRIEGEPRSSRAGSAPLFSRHRDRSPILPPKKQHRPSTPIVSGSFDPIKNQLIPLPKDPSASSINVTEMNVLLLGETGVGKSTFINAFVNYLQFDSLQQAEQGEPTILIPTSFPITSGENCEEFIVHFGTDDLNEHEGQTVTQSCKSYIFELNNRLRLRLIDTPGVGDSRGAAYDAKNMDHILHYINDLPHLNAVCLLLKPSTSRMNILFRSCLTRLLTYLTPASYDNFIFCFTNARTTFYAPGDAGPVLRKMLSDEDLSDIQLRKENTFCFDSESFRYLAARKCGIQFDGYEKEDYKTSWTTSMNESVRLINYIKRCPLYYLQEWLSPRKAILDICKFARPFMETLRLITYNWKLKEAGLITHQIMLYATPLHIDMCINCAQANIVKVGSFWIAEYQPVHVQDTINQHIFCPLDEKYYLMESIVKYQSIPLPAGLQDERWQSAFRKFLFKCDRLVHFLRQQGLTTQMDPFQPILEQYLKEEKEILQHRDKNTNMNRRVYETLNLAAQVRQQNNQYLFDSGEKLSLYEVYQIIDDLATIETVKKQMDIIKRSHQIKLEQSELKLPTNILRNKVFF